MERLRELQVEFHRAVDARRFYNRVQNPFITPKETALAERIAAEMLPGGARLLEIGCGEGSNLYFLTSQLPGCQLFGIDFSAPKVHFLSETVAGVRGICADVTHLPFRGDHFDLVLCRDLLHHVNWARDAVIGEALRVLRRGGAFVVFESNGRALLNRVFRALYRAERGIKDSTPETFGKLFGGYGGARLAYVEASFLVRALGFLFGWPDGAARIVLSPLYWAAGLWERLVAALLPRHRWVYMMLVIRRL